MVVLVQLEDVDPEVGAVAELVHHQVGILGVLGMGCLNDFARRNELLLGAIFLPLRRMR